MDFVGTGETVRIGEVSIWSSLPADVLWGLFVMH